MEPIDNYGSIRTENASQAGMRGDSVDGNINVIINNHATMSVQEETDVDSVRTIKNNTPVTDVVLDKIYKIVETVVGTV